MSAPVVVAKGRNLLAERIKQLARWHEIPIIENRILAQALYKTTDVGQTIPPQLYERPLPKFLPSCIAHRLACWVKKPGRISELVMAAEAKAPLVASRKGSFDWLLPVAAVGMVFMMLVPCAEPRAGYFSRHQRDAGRDCVAMRVVHLEARAVLQYSPRCFCF